MKRHYIQIELMSFFLFLILMRYLVGTHLEAYLIFYWFLLQLLRLSCMYRSTLSFLFCIALFFAIDAYP